MRATFIALFLLGLTPHFVEANSLNDDSGEDLTTEVYIKHALPTLGNFNNQGSNFLGTKANFTCGSVEPVPQLGFFRNKSTCPEHMQKIFSWADNAFLYDTFHGNTPYEHCSRDVKLESKEFGFAYKHLSKRIAWDIDYSKDMVACQIEARMSLGRIEEPLAGLFVKAQPLYYHQRFQTGAVKAMQGLHEIDFLLGKKNYSMDGIECNKETSMRIFASCSKLKACPKNRSKIKNLSKMTMTALKSIKSLKKKRVEIEDQLGELAATMGMNQEKNKKAVDGINAILTSLDLIDENIEEIESTIPWTKGSVFKDEMEKIQSELDRIDEISIKDDPLLEERQKLRRESSLSRDIGTLMMKQLLENKNALLSRYDSSLRGIDCLKGKANCENFEKDLEKSPPYKLDFNIPDNDNQLTRSYHFMNSVSCINDEVNKAKGYNEVAVDVGTIALGFGLGGVGGVLKLAHTAGRIFVRGNRIKALASGTLLGAEAAAVSKGFEDMKKSCTETHMQIHNFKNDEKSKVACNEEKNMHVVKDYSDCLRDMALFSANIVSVGAADIVKTLRKNRSKPKAVGTKINSRINTRQTLTNSGLTGPEVNKILKHLDTFELNDTEIKKVNELFENLSIEPGKTNQLEDYLTYFVNSNRKKQQEIIDNLASANAKGSKQGLDSSMFDKWRGLKLRFDRYEEKTFEKLSRRYQAKGLQPGPANARAAKDARAKRVEFEQNRRGCSASKVTPQHKKASKIFTRFSVGLGLGSATYGYAKAHRYDEKDMEFFSKLGYELVMTYMLSKLGAKIASNPTNGYLKKYMKATVVSSGLDAIDAGIYSSFFGASEEDAEATLMRIKNSPEKLEALKKLEKFLGDNNWVEKAEAAMISNMQNILEDPDLASDTELSGPLTPDMLDDPVRAERIKGLIMEEMYNKERATFNFGDKGVDRWMYNRGWNGLVGINKGILTGMMTYALLCRGAAYPMASMGGAVALQFANQFISADYYYSNRKDLIGQ